MFYLFSSRGLRELEPFLAAGTLLAFDFDGTLAPIVPNPARAILPSSTRALLQKLSRRAPVAFLSGRSLADLKKRTPAKAKAWVGNHGLEGLPSQTAFVKAASRNTGAWQNALLPRLPAGVVLENKGFSLSLHYRRSPRPVAAARELRKLAEGLEPSPRLIPGKKVLNLVTAGQPHKGHALQQLLKRTRLSQAIFVGDDDTDEDVFRLGDPRIFSVRVGHRRSSAAQAYLKDQGEADALLRLLLERS